MRGAGYLSRRLTAASGRRSTLTANMPLAASLRFYELATEIIPVLFIAVLVGGAVEAGRGAELKHRFQLMAWIVVTMALALFGELAALHSVYDGHASSTSRALTIIGLGAMAVALISAVYWRFLWALFPNANIYAAINTALLLQTILIVGVAVYLRLN